MSKTRILIVDDHALMRMGLRSMLDMQSDMEVVGEAGNGQKAIDLAKSLTPDIIIMDLMMPKVNGAEATKAILDALPGTKIIILTSFGNSADLARAISNGAAGVQMKDAPTEALLKAIRKVMRGETAIPPELLKDGELESAAIQLTEKQSEILQSVVRGYVNKDIAKQFGISEAGVKKHLRLIFAKLGAANRSEAVGIALRKHLLKI